MVEYIEIECGFCGHTEDVEAQVEQDEFWGTDYVDCSDCFGADCPKCGEKEAMCPSGGGGSHFADAQAERRQMGLCNF